MRRYVPLLLAIALTVPPIARAQKAAGYPLPITGRSMVLTKLGIVAASQPLAAKAGVQILERGGNAIDAAIAANAVMGLVEPEMNGIGGDLFAIVYQASTKKLFAALTTVRWVNSVFISSIVTVANASAASSSRPSTGSPRSEIRPCAASCSGTKSM